jgi:hypothetical protein
LQDSNYACLTKEAKANNPARPIKEARALDVEIDSKNTIIVHILKGATQLRVAKVVWLV